MPRWMNYYILWAMSKVNQPKSIPEGTARKKSAESKMKWNESQAHVPATGYPPYMACVREAWHDMYRLGELLAIWTDVYFNNEVNSITMAQRNLNEIISISTITFLPMCNVCTKSTALTTQASLVHKVQLRCTEIRPFNLHSCISHRDFFVHSTIDDQKW